MNLGSMCRLQILHCIGVGDEVVVNGLQGRGMVVGRKGKRLTIRYRDGLYVSRDEGEVHSLSDNTYKSPYRSDRND